MTSVSKPVNSPLLAEKANNETQLSPPFQMAMEVPKAFREGQGMRVPVSQALAYSHGLPHQNLKDYQGCYKCHVCCELPVCCCYLVACGDTCVYTPWCFLGIPVPVWGCIVCACERNSNSFTFRGRHGEKTGELLFVDSEKKTLAYWPVICCSDKLEENTCCYCTKAGT